MSFDMAFERTTVVPILSLILGIGGPRFIKPVELPLWTLNTSKDGGLQGPRATSILRASLIMTSQPNEITLQRLTAYKKETLSKISLR